MERSLSLPESTPDDHPRISTWYATAPCHPRSGGVTSISQCPLTHSPHSARTSRTTLSSTTRFSRQPLCGIGSGLRSFGSPPHRERVDALFAHNLLLPLCGTEQGGEWTIWHAPTMITSPDRHATRSSTAIAISFEEQTVLIAGTRYAGEIKKAMFTVMNGWLPSRGVLPMHCSANEGPQGDTALFFGLSGTGKTTLSTGGGRRLIGDDEHGWSDEGIFNLGGSYAKTIGLSAESEPEIFHAAQQFGSVLENVILEPSSQTPQFDDPSRTENTSAAFPLRYIDPQAGGSGAHPRNIIFLSADAYGVLPPVARLTRDQALYWSLSGYTSKLATRHGA